MRMLRKRVFQFHYGWTKSPIKKVVNTVKPISENQKNNVFNDQESIYNCTGF